MNTSIRILFLAIIGMCLFACNREDSFSKTEETSTSTTDEFYLSGEISGLILDEDKLPIEGAVVQMGQNSSLTDEYGFFKLKDVDVSNNGSLIKITKAGYFDGFKFAYLIDGKRSYMEAHLVSAKSYQVSGQMGGEISIDGGAILEFRAESIVASSGSPYNGEVMVQAHWYDPVSEELSEQMPGDLRGQNLDGESVQLVSYGMMAVELFSSTGEELQLKEGETATLSFPLNGLSDAPDEIPLWSLDEDTGVWIEEGTAIKVGDKYVGEVSHFSFWNCDEDFPLVNMKGRLLDKDGQPIVNQTVIIKVGNGSLTGSGQTNEAGEFQGKMPQGLVLHLSLGVCQNNDLNYSFGPFMNDEDLGDITINEVSSTQIIVNLIDCLGESIPNGIVLVTQDNTRKIFEADADGSINSFFNSCNSSDLRILGIDVTGAQQSEDIVIGVSLDTYEEPALMVCGDFVEQFLNFGFSAALLSYEDAEVYIVDDKYIHISAVNPNLPSNQEHFHHFYLKDPDPDSEFKAFYTSIAPTSDGSRPFNWYPIDDPYLFVPESVSKIGDVIKGSSNIHPALNLDFLLTVDDKFNSGKARGIVWRDLNGDGIQDIDEPVVQGVRVTVRAAISGFGYLSHNDTVFSDENGEFLFELLVPGQEYFLSYNGNEQDLTVVNIGDDASDSDFSDSFGSYIQTETFTVADGEVLSGFGLGLLP